MFKKKLQIDGKSNSKIGGETTIVFHHKMGKSKKRRKRLATEFLNVFRCIIELIFVISFVTIVSKRLIHEPVFATSDS